MKEIKEIISNKAITALFAFILMLALANIALNIYTLAKSTGFETKEYQGHTYLFHNGRPVEHCTDCKKCYERFD